MSSMAKLKVAGAWVGVLEVELDNWTVPMLRAEVARRSNLGTESINLISAGKVLRDDDGSQNLSQLGLKNNSKVLASRVAVDEGKSLKAKFLAEEERIAGLARLNVLILKCNNQFASGVPTRTTYFDLSCVNRLPCQDGILTCLQSIFTGLSWQNKFFGLALKNLYVYDLFSGLGAEAASLPSSQQGVLVD